MSRESEFQAGHPEGRSRLARIAGTISACVLLAYPLVVFPIYREYGPRFSALVLLTGLSLAAILRGPKLTGQLRALGLLPFITMGVLAMGAVLDNAGLLFSVPAITNGLLLVSWSLTLGRRYSPPMIERFARLVEPELSPEKVRWCRAWTLIWCLFFVVNGTVAMILAVTGPMTLWALYNGLIAYVLIGVLFAVEWTMRRLRFGHAKENGHDAT